MTISYPYIPEGRSIKYVPADNVFMKEAMRECMEHSTDDSQPVGSVIVTSNNIIGQGSNFAALQSPFLKNLHEKGWCVRKILKIKTGEKYWLCPGCGGYDMHSEARAILDVIKNGKSTVGADLYLWGHWWCCKPCWDKMIAAGIRDVYLLEGSEVLFNPANPANKRGRSNFSHFI